MYQGDDTRVEVAFAADDKRSVTAIQPARHDAPDSMMARGRGVGYAGQQVREAEGGQE